MKPSGNIRLFSTDLDGTLLGRPEAAWRFMRAWREIDPRRRPLLVYNTGRSVRETRALISAELLIEPDFIIGGVGTEFHDALYNRTAEFHAQFGGGWDRASIEAIVATMPGVTRQADDTGRPAFKSSWIWPRARREQIDALRQQLVEAGFEATVVYSCQHFLDVLPACAGKGAALAWLCRRLGIALEHVLVAGDTANDTSMYLLPGVRGIVVENALPELRADLGGTAVFAAQLPVADGVLEGLAHYGVLAAERAPAARLVPA